MGSPRWRDVSGRALANTADRIASDQTVSPAFLYAALLWPAVNARQKKLAGNDVAQVNAAIAQASDEILAQAHKYISIPKRSEEHTSELQSLMHISYAVFCLQKKTKTNKTSNHYLRIH